MLNTEHAHNQNLSISFLKKAKCCFRKLNLTGISSVRKGTFPVVLWRKVKGDYRGNKLFSKFM